MPKKSIEEKEPTVYDFLRFGESYTSLILGIVVVIVSTMLLLSFVHNRNKTVNTPNEQRNVAQATRAPEATPTVVVAAKPVATKAPTVTPAPTKVVVAKKINPTATPKVVKAKVAKAVTPTAKPTPAMKPNPTQRVKTYTVLKGDTLWVIAEKTYKSGYNWVDIARANNLNNPDDIHAGNTLVLPKVEPKVATVPTLTVTAQKTVAQTPAVTVPSKITGTSYTVVKGDNLWNISVRAYGDGYQWVKIAQVNHLVNPGLIHSGNVLTIPRN